MTFDELVASLRQIDGQRDKGKHPPNFHFRSKPHALTAASGAASHVREPAYQQDHGLRLEVALVPSA